MDLNIHHTGVAVRDLAAAAEKYIAYFGYRKRTGIIHDPIQEAYVQFLHLPGDSGYLEVVQPDRPEAKLSQVVAKGGGLHHICYSVADIETACNELSARGMYVIASPAPAVAFGNRRIAWLIGKNVCLTELVERGEPDEL